VHLPQAKGDRKPVVVWKKKRFLYNLQALKLIEQFSKDVTFF